MKVLAIVAVAAIGTTSALESASAQSCASLQAQYKSALRGSGGGGASTSSLKRQLAAAQSEASRKNCRRLFRRASDCRAVNAKVSRLQRQLSQASRGTRSASSGSASRLRSQLRRNGCAVPGGGDFQFAGSGYRTLCVRTCDGFYFPINFRSNRSRFKTDEAVCKAMYGGAGAELFYHSNGGSPERAVSMNGKPLAGEPYAFAYRRSFSESCQGELKRGLANLAKVFEARGTNAKFTKGTTKEVAEPRVLPTPLARVDVALDPDTKANLMAGFVAKRVTPEGEEVEVLVAEMRKLGDDYYYSVPETIAAIYEPPDLGPEFTLFSQARADERADMDDVSGAAAATTVQ